MSGSDLSKLGGQPFGARSEFVSHGNVELTVLKIPAVGLPFWIAINTDHTVRCADDFNR